MPTRRRHAQKHADGRRRREPRVQTVRRRRALVHAQVHGNAPIAFGRVLVIRRRAGRAALSGFVASVSVLRARPVAAASARSFSARVTRRYRGSLAWNPTTRSSSASDRASSAPPPAPPPRVLRLFVCFVFGVSARAPQAAAARVRRLSGRGRGGWTSAGGAESAEECFALAEETVDVRPAACAVDRWAPSARSRRGGARGHPRAFPLGRAPGARRPRGDARGRAARGAEGERRGDARDEVCGVRDGVLGVAGCVAGRARARRASHSAFETTRAAPWHEPSRRDPAENRRLPRRRAAPRPSPAGSAEGTARTRIVVPSAETRARPPARAPSTPRPPRASRSLPFFRSLLATARVALADPRPGAATRASSRCACTPCTSTSRPRRRSRRTCRPSRWRKRRHRDGASRHARGARGVATTPAPSVGASSEQPRRSARLTNQG